MTWEGAPPDTPGTFADELAALGESGGAFLVVGDVGPGAHADCCERWLGDPGRHRVFVCAGGPPPTVTADASVLTLDADVRSTVVPTASTPGDARHAASLSDLGAAVVDELESIPSPGPGAVRVCVADAAALCEAAGEEAVFRFLHLLRTRVAADRGLMHVHAPGPADAELVFLLEPIVDGTVTLRAGEAGVCEHWRLHDTGRESGWLPVE